jgi:hypothetical protein
MIGIDLDAINGLTGGRLGTVLSHPSLTGIRDGTGISGSTAWHGAFRFRQYLNGIKPDAGEQPEGDLRQLEFKKNQYGPVSDFSSKELAAAMQRLLDAGKLRIETFGPPSKHRKRLVLA